MARQLLTINQFYRGISPSNKLGDVGYFNFAQNMDIYSEPTSVTLNPKTVKESGTVVTGLIKWFVEGEPYDFNLYAVDENGAIYQRTSLGVWSIIQSTANCVGQGLGMFSDYLYYVQNTQIGRYGPLSGVPSFTDNWQTGLNDTSVFGFAPFKAFRAGFAVGNENDLAWYDGSVWTQNRITLPIGFHIRSLEVVDEYLAIAAWRGGAITGTVLTSSQEEIGRAHV